MEPKNPKYTLTGSIDLQIDHPQYGWIPCTVSSDDPQTKDLYNRAISGEFGTIAAYIEPEINLDDYKEILCDKLEEQLPKVFSSGFEYKNYSIQADPIAQQNAHAFLTTALAGEASFPLQWRTKDNSFMPLSTIEEVKAFGKAMLGFVQGEYQRIWHAKDAVRAAASKEEADSAFASYRG